MIARIIPRPKEGSSFGLLARYVVNARGQGDPATWARTLDYILDSGNAHEKVGSVRVSNCYSDDAADAALEILNTQGRNTRSKTDKTMHLVISFPPGEQPAAATLAHIEDHLCAALGLADHQRISAVHIDTEHLHVHVAINTVHPRTFRNIDPWYGEHRLMEACERLEPQFGLQRTNHGIEARDARRRHYQEEKQDDRLNRIELSERDRRILRESYAQAIAEETEATTLNGVRTLSGSGVVRVAGDGEVLLSGDEGDHVEHGGAQPAQSVRRPSDGDGAAGGGVGQSDVGSVEANRGADLSGRAASMEQHAGRESFERWIRGHAGAGIIQAAKEAKNWQQFHQALAPFDLTIRRRGAGLAIVTKDGRAGVKATMIARSLSLSRLTSRWGAYQDQAPGTGETVRAREAHAPRYTGAPKHTAPDTSAIFTDYQRARDAALRDRATAQARLKAQHAKYRSDLAAWYARRRSAIKLNTTLLGPAKRLAYAALRQERIADRARRLVLEKNQRAAITVAHPLPTWQTYINQAAEKGDTAALAVLRSREHRASKHHRDWIGATDDERAAQLVMARLKPQAQKNGDILYRTADGARVIDARSNVRVNKTTEDAVKTALALASQRFSNQALKVQGSDAFKAALVQASVARGMHIRFADVAMEQARQAGLAAKQAAHSPSSASTAAAPDAPPASPSHSRSRRGSFDAVKPATQPATQPSTKPANEGLATPSHAAFIAKRNLFASKMADISYNHRLWGSRDAGPSVYQGRRKLEDGTEVLLLLRGETMLVKPASTIQVAKASRWRVGDTVQTDERGRFVTNRGQKR